MIRKQILPDDKRRDIDFGYRDIVVREGKEQHERDLKRGGGYVTLPTLPEALERKYQAANRQWGWQWVFPAQRQFREPATGCLFRRHLHDTVIQRAVEYAKGS